MFYTENIQKHFITLNLKKKSREIGFPYFEKIFFVHSAEKSALQERNCQQIKGFTAVCFESLIKTTIKKCSGE